MRFHLFPFRTEKLSSLTPMVLRFSRGRVGSRLFKVRSKGLTFFVVVVSYGWLCGNDGLCRLTLKRRQAAKDIDNHPKPRLDRRGLIVYSRECGRQKIAAGQNKVTEPSEPAVLRPLERRGLLFTAVWVEGKRLLPCRT